MAGSFGSLLQDLHIEARVLASANTFDGTRKLVFAFRSLRHSVF